MNGGGSVRLLSRSLSPSHELFTCAAEAAQVNGSSVSNY
jgi:hypothetical protein